MNSGPAPRPVNLKCVAGDTIQLRFAVTDQDGEITDISGFTLRFAVRRPGADAPTLSTPTQVQAAVTNAGAGEFLVTVPAAQTRGKIGDYDWQCEVESPSGIVSTVGLGNLEMLPSVAGQ